MIFTAIPMDSAPHFLAATAAATISLICLTILLLFRSYRLMGWLGLLYAGLAVHLAGVAGWLMQGDEGSIIFHHRLILIGLLWLPVSWFMILGELFDARWTRWGWMTAGVTLALSLAVGLVNHPWLISGPLIKSGAPALLRPTTGFLRIIVMLLPLGLGLPMLVYFVTSYSQKGLNAKAAAAMAVAAVGWLIGGLHDLVSALTGKYLVLHGPAIWLASLWLTFWLALAMAILYRSTDASLSRRTEDLVTARTGSMLGACSAQVARQVRTFLDRMTASLGVIRREELSPAAVETLDTLEAGAVRLSEFTGRFRNFALKPSLDFQAARLDDELNRILTRLDSAIRARGLKVAFSGATAFSLVADWALMRKVLEILLVNALDGARERGRINVSAEHHRDGMTLIEVADDGPGLAPSIRNAILEPLLFTVDDAAGMDMLLVRNILEAHGGGIELVGMAGMGTVIRLSVPIRPAMGQ